MGFLIMDKAVILLSGGLDSSTLLHYVRKTLGCGHLYAISFHYGQKHSREIQCAAWQARASDAKEHKLVDMTALGTLTAGASALTDAGIPVPDFDALPADQRDQPPTYVPNRNMILLALASAYAEARGIPDVFYGAQTQDRYGYWDCTPEFLDRMNAVLALNRRQAVCIKAPFVRMSKREIVTIGRGLGVDYAHTWTCYRGEQKACGTCLACEDRLSAFRRLGWRDPLDYVQSAGQTRCHGVYLRQ